MSFRTDLEGDVVVPGTLTVLGGINSQDFSEVVTRQASTEQNVTEIKTRVEAIDTPIVRGIRSSAPTVVVKADGAVSPAAVTFSSYQAQGQTVTPYPVFFKLYKDDVLYYEAQSLSATLLWTVQVVTGLNPGPETFPSLNLFPAFTNKVVRAEAWDALSGGTKIDSIEIAVQPSWQGYIQNELGAMAPRYKGRYEGAHPASYNNYDSWLVYDSDDAPIQRGLYVAVDYTPTRVTTASPMALQARMADAVGDVAWVEKQGTYGVAADYGIQAFFENLAAVTAFVTNLSANTAFIDSLIAKRLEVLTDNFSSRIDATNGLLMKKGDNTILSVNPDGAALFSGSLKCGPLELMLGADTTTTISGSAGESVATRVNAVLSALGMAVGGEIPAVGSAGGYSDIVSITISKITTTTQVNGVGRRLQYDGYYNYNWNYKTWDLNYVCQKTTVGYGLSAKRAGGSVVYIVLPTAKTESYTSWTFLSVGNYIGITQSFSGMAGDWLPAALSNTSVDMTTQAAFSVQTQGSARYIIKNIQVGAPGAGASQGLVYVDGDTKALKVVPWW